jgi:phosphoglucosamine mutase
MGKLFGTDGVRGVAGKDLTCELALQIGRATAAELTSLDGHRPRILIGKDTRVSGDMLECTLAAGLCSVGADVDLLGVIPTPGVAYLVRKYGADAGIVISASHNPMEFNGIKIFKGDGYKLPDEVENRIEAHIFKNCEDIKICDGAEIGRVHRLDTAVDDYVDALEQHIDADLSGLNVLFDCANGASAKVAQKLFPRLGCQCSFTGTLDDGVSVNDGCGSTHLDRLEKKVVEGGFDCGIAFDGDADRCLACDEKGAEIDGDKIIALVAKDMKDRGRLDGNTAVVTVMSNLGFMKYMQSIGIDTARTAVGDRYVLEEMRARGYAIGGEQSGHVIFLHHSTTGDGELTAGKLLKLLARKHREEGTKMSELNAVYTKFPQVLINLTADKEQKQAYKEDEYIAGFIESQQQNLMGMGRVLVRVSGTEPKIRVMVEGEDMEAIQSATRAACIHENIVQFPDGYETIVGERGVTLSGGQKQRSSIARALMKNAPILILDDALSAVDTDTEEHILTNLKKNREGKTTILIAHRISTIQNADIIMVLEDGTAAEIGNHDSLMAKHGIYYDMFEKQQLEAIHGEAGKALIRQDHPAAKTGKEDA